MRKLSSLAAIGSAMVLLAACSSTPVAPVVTKDAVPVAVAPASGATAASAVTPVNAGTTLESYLDPQSALYKERSVYFDFDQFVIKSDSARVVEMHGKYLASHPKVSIRIEGNTDAQGGKEYNLALGQKRAEAVAKTLKVFGVTAAQMEAVSFGAEKPKTPGHDEAAYAQNRRADLAYPAK